LHVVNTQNWQKLSELLPSQNYQIFTQQKLSELLPSQNYQIIAQQKLSVFLPNKSYQNFYLTKAIKLFAW
jgi:hypothetical protein